MGDYLIKQYEYMKTLTFEQIERGEINWNVYKVSTNFKDRILKYNSPMSVSEFEIESECDFETKKFHYNYRHEDELKEEYLLKTFANISASNEIYDKTQDKGIREE